MPWKRGDIIRYEGEEQKYLNAKWLILRVDEEGYFICDRWNAPGRGEWAGFSARRALAISRGFILCVKASEIPTIPSPCWEEFCLDNATWPPPQYRTNKSKESTFLERLGESLAADLRRKPAKMPNKCVRCSESMSASLDCYYGGDEKRCLVKAIPGKQLAAYELIVTQADFWPGLLCSKCRPKGA